MDRGGWQATVHGVARVRHDLVTKPPPPPPYAVIGLPWWLSSKESACNAGATRCKFDPWIGMIPWWRKWQLTPVFLPQETHGQRSLAGYGPWGRKESDMTEATEHIHGIFSTFLFLYIFH